MNNRDYTPAMLALHCEIIRCVKKFATPPHSVHPVIEVALVSGTVGMLTAGLVKTGMLDEGAAGDLLAENAAAGYDYAMNKTASDAA